jgi:2-keto-4-pentenoate hydratase/2-oxohepta-3-ene-1,7-dioic acid hydratase in catechol pathway
MKLMRIGALGAEHPALLADNGTVLDLSGLTADIDGAFLASGGIDRVRRGIAEGALPRLEATGERIGAPIARPGKVVCIGLNYRDHAQETGAAIPGRPVVFLKWDLGKSCETFNPLGPYLVTSDEIPAGVALGLPGNPYLRPGDRVELEITGLGAQTQILAEA